MKSCFGKVWLAVWVAMVFVTTNAATAAIFTPLTVAELVSAITTANTNLEDDIIDLGGNTFSLTVINNGANGLPVVLSAAISGSLTITNGTIERNAGAMASFRILEVAQGASLTLDGVTLRNGSSSTVLNQGTLTVSNSWFVDNFGLDGGAIENAFSGSIPLISGSTFSDNAANNGGAIFNSGIITTISNSTFSGNTAVANGGAIENAGPPPRSGSIGNKSVLGSVGSGLITMIMNSTVAGNVAANGGGISNSVPSSIQTLVSTIVASNTATVGPDIFNQGVIASESNNLIGDNSGSPLVAGAPNPNNSYVGTVMTPIDPGLGPLQNNGGPTMTRAVLAMSVAIDHGSNPVALVFDQRGTPFLRTSGTQTDIGAFELQAVTDLSVTKADSPDPVNEGTILTYTITVTNPGSDADTVTLSDSVPADTTFVSLTSAAGWNCTTPAVGGTGTITCTIATFAAGSAEFTLVVNVDAPVSPGTVVSNTATVSSNTADPDINNNTATATTTVAAGSADLTITKSDSPDPVTAGANLTYTITVTNTGPINAASAALNDTLPPGTTFVSLTSPAGWNCTTPAVGGTGTITCTLATFAAGSAQFTLVVNVNASVTAGTVISNTATASSTTPDPTTPNTVTATTTVAASADLSITKVDTPDPVTVGTNITYTITMINAGPSNAATAQLSDTLPAGTTFVSLTSPAGWNCTTPAVGAGGSVSCANPSFAAGGSAQFTLIVTVDASVVSGTVISNTATASSTTPDANTGNQSATATTTVISSAVVGGTKTVTGSFVVGGTVTYTVVLTNTGDAAQQDNPGDEFADVLPAALVLVSASATSGIVTAVGNTVHWNGSIAVGGSVTLTILATVTPAASGLSVVNQGTINFDADGNGTNERTTVTDDPAPPGAADPTVFQVAQVAQRAIPTLSDGGFVLLVLALAALGLRRIRGRRIRG